MARLAAARNNAQTGRDLLFVCAVPTSSCRLAGLIWRLVLGLDWATTNRTLDWMAATLLLSASLAGELVDSSSGLV